MDNKKRGKKYRLKEVEEDIKRITGSLIDDQAADDDNVSVTDAVTEDQLAFDRLFRKPRGKLLKQLPDEPPLTDDVSSEEDSDGSIDTKIYRIGCDRGFESDTVFAITYKYQLDRQFGEEAKIFATYAWKERFPGAIFIESNNYLQMRAALNDIRFVRHYDILPMPREFQAKMFRVIQETELHIQAGQWVRVKQHQLYHNDLGKVLKVNANHRTAQIKVISRELLKTPYLQPKKTKMSEALKQKMFTRGPKLPIKVQNQLDLPSQTQNSSHTTKTNFCYRSLMQESIRAKVEGFTLITLSMNNLQDKNFKVTPKEVLEFFPDVEHITRLPHEIRAEFMMIHGQESVNPTTQTTNVTQPIPEQIVAKFKQYDYVYVVDGEHIGQHGIILQLMDNHARISTFDNKLVEAHVLDLNKKNINQGMIEMKPEIGFKKFDLVSFGQIELDVGCIQGIHNNEVTVLDIHNRTRIVNVFALKELKSWSTLLRGQVVQIKDGAYKGSQANVIQVYNEKSFLFNVKFPQCIIVEHQDNLSDLDTGDTKILNHRKNQFLLGGQSTILKGPWMGYRGIIVGMREQCATVQLFAKHLKVKVCLDNLDVH